MFSHFSWNQDVKKENNLREKVDISPWPMKKLSEDTLCFSKLL